MLLRQWSVAAPIAAILGYLMKLTVGAPAVLLGVVLIAAVLAAVHHAEVVAHKVGEPLGTFLLAVAVTVIEVGLILTLMLAGGEHASSLARDTVFAAVMIILNGLLGLCILLGALKHREQTFQPTGVAASLSALSALTVLTLVLPNATVSEPGPEYAPAQLAFVAIVSLILYATFVTVQTIRHRDYFLPPEAKSSDADVHAPKPTRSTAITSAVLLVVCLVAVVVLAKALAPTIEEGVASAGAPEATVGVIIAALVLLPESVAAARAALLNRLQTSLNLAMGSAMATIGLTIPAVAALSIAIGLPLSLGLDGKGMVLLLLTLLMSGLSLATGRTTILQGVVHLVIFGVFCFTTLIP
jgi:Ca2+:H+ antiporter